MDKITIKKVRQELGVTQESMGKLMGMSQSSIARIETGPRSETKQQVMALRSLISLHEAGLL